MNYPLCNWDMAPYAKSYLILTTWTCVSSYFLLTYLACLPPLHLTASPFWASLTAICPLGIMFWQPARIPTESIAWWLSPTGGIVWPQGRETELLYLKYRIWLAYFMTLFHPQFGHWGPGRWDQNDCSLMGSTGAKTSEGSVENEKKLLTEKTLDISTTFSMVNVLVLDWLLFINNVLIRKIISALVLKYVICLMGKDDCPLLICSLLWTLQCSGNNIHYTHTHTYVYACVCVCVYSQI